MPHFILIEFQSIDFIDEFAKHFIQLELAIAVCLERNREKALTLVSSIV